MSLQLIDVGSAYDDPAADKRRDAFVKCNDNFTELYSFDFCKVQAIGTWDMSSTGTLSKEVAYEAPTGYVVAGAFVNIIGDDGVLYSHGIGISTEAVAIQYNYTNETFTIFTSSSGYFYNSNFDGTSSNRGYIIVILDKV